MTETISVDKCNRCGKPAYEYTLIDIPDILHCVSNRCSVCNSKVSYRVVVDEQSKQPPDEKDSIIDQLIAEIDSWTVTEMIDYVKEDFRNFYEDCSLAELQEIQEAQKK